VWWVFSVPHLACHLLHLDMYDLIDQVLNVVSLSYFVVVGAVLAAPWRARQHTAGRNVPLSG
jgi:hypothetical protein